MMVMLLSVLGGCAQRGTYYDADDEPRPRQHAVDGVWGTTSTGSTYSGSNPAFIVGPNGRAENVYDGGPTQNGGIRSGNQIHYPDGRPTEFLYGQ